MVRYMYIAMNIKSNSVVHRLYVTTNQYPVFISWSSTGRVNFSPNECLLLGASFTGGEGRSLAFAAAGLWYNQSKSDCGILKFKIC